MLQATLVLYIHIYGHSASDLQGVISVKTLTEIDRMRKGGVKIVLITGARLSTLLMRMAFLPAADAYVCENGGRIYYPNATLTVALPIAEDTDWRKSHNVTGEPSLNSCLHLTPVCLQHNSRGKSASKATANFASKDI